MKVLLVDDHAIVRDGLRRLLATLGGEEVVDAATAAKPWRSPAASVLTSPSSTSTCRVLAGWS